MTWSLNYKEEGTGVQDQNMLRLIAGWLTLGFDFTTSSTLAHSSYFGP